jgi:serine phosphatase RsbU (regulator of sigma subunit)
MFRAVKINRKRGDQLDYARLLNNIGTTYHSQKKYKEALEYCSKGLILAKEVGALEYIASSEKELSEIYSEINDYKNAFLHYHSYIAIKDSLFNEENTAELVRSEMNFDFEKKQAVAKAEQEKKDAINAGELKQQRMQRNYFIAGFILMIALALFIFKGYNEKKRANSIIAEQKAIVEEKNKDITDSINYARRIQTAILPSLESIRSHLPQSFVLYQPKDIVSGDFYWFTEKEERLILAVADCTGHGVPGAFMSMIGNDILTQIVIEKGYLEPGQILAGLHEGVKNALKQDTGTGETKDGMDIALISIHKNTNIVEYAGALRPLWLIKSGAAEVEEYKADKYSIGGTASKDERVFTNHTIQVGKGDSVYLSTDGFADQFGGEKGKKFMTRRMKDLLISMANKPMSEQKVILLDAFSEWKQKRDQVDDVLVVGIKL